MRESSNKIVVIVIAITMALTALGFTACSNSDEPHESARSTYVDEHNKKDDSESTSAIVEDSEWEVLSKGTLPASENRLVVYRDTKTDVIWVLQDNRGDGGSSFCPRVNSDGSYMTYQQYLKSESEKQ
jgi:hypothetical protein